MLQSCCIRKKEPNAEANINSSIFSLEPFKMWKLKQVDTQTQKGSRMTLLIVIVIPLNHCKDNSFVQAHSMKKLVNFHIFRNS